jgi:hypothetical protein
MGLGALNLVSLAEARPRRHASSAGIDPVTAKKAARAAISFDECAEQFIAPRGQGWKNRKHREQWHVRLRTQVSILDCKREVSPCSNSMRSSSARDKLVRLWPRE